MKTKPALSCEYCEDPERYNLDPAVPECWQELSSRAMLRPDAWHYERIVYCRDVPRMRVPCRINSRRA